MGTNIFLTPPQAGTPDFMMLKSQRIQIPFPCIAKQGLSNRKINSLALTIYIFG